jgi:cyanophycinase-like exopeptidase
MLRLIYYDGTMPRKEEINWCIVSGGAKPFEKEYLYDHMKSNGAKKILIIAPHHTSQAAQYVERLKNLDSRWKNEMTLFHAHDYGKKYVISDFDGMYISGGLHLIFQHWMEYGQAWDDLHDLEKWPKVYAGASVGAQILTKYFNTEMETDALHLSQFVDTGFSLFTEVLLEIHFDEDDLRGYRKNRLVQTLMENPQLEYAYGMNGNCVVRGIGNNFEKREILKGSAFKIDRDGNEVEEK